MTTRAKGTTPTKYFLTVAWRGEGIRTAFGRPTGSGSIWAVWADDRGREHEVWGRLGASIFETREAANDAVKKKATAALKRMRRELARIEAIAANGVS